MKIHILLPLGILALLFLGSCASEPPPPPIPLIERNPEVRKYIDVLSELVDEYCTLVETTVEKAAEMEDTSESDNLSALFQSVDMLSGMATSLMKIKNLSDEISSMETQKAAFEKNLSAEDFKEFMTLYTMTLKRFYDLAKKAESLNQ